MLVNLSTEQGEAHPVGKSLRGFGVLGGISLHRVGLEILGLCQYEPPVFSIAHEQGSTITLAAYSSVVAQAVTYLLGRASHPPQPEFLRYSGPSRRGPS